MSPRALIAVLVILGLAVPTALAEVPSSPRARAAMARVAPDLKADVAAAGLDWGSPLFLRIFKRERVLEGWLESTPGGPFVLFRSWPVCAASGDPGPKTAQGDRQAPEGFYFVTPGRMNPMSRFHLSFNLGYPNALERARGWTGSALMVHGDCVSAGCYAMARRWLPVGADRNDPINEIWTLMDAAFKHGQPLVRVHAFPFRLTEINLARHRDHPWADFWANLAEGYRWFETHRRPPDVTVRKGRYRFAPAP